MKFSIGCGKDKPTAKRLDVAELLPWLRLSHKGTEDWFSPHLWKGDKRSTENWEAGCATVLDYDAPEGTPPEFIKAEHQHIGKISLPGNLLYLTPNGCRIIYLWKEEVVDPRIQSAAQLTLAGDLNVLRKFLALKEDTRCTQDLARLFYAPNTHAKGRARASPVRILREEPYDALPLAQVWLEHLQREEFKRRFAAEWATPSRTSKPREKFADAVQRFNADHAGTAEEWRNKDRSCPFCNHKGCFGVLPKSSPPKWFCWSANHTEGGKKTARGWVGDALDYVAGIERLTRAEVLLKEGYLMARGHKNARS